MQNSPTFGNDGGAYADRFDDWRLLDGVRTRRIFAFLIDYFMVFLLIVVAVPVKYFSTKSVFSPTASKICAPQ